MSKKKVRVFVGKDGCLVVEDPSPLEVEILKRLGIKIAPNPHATFGKRSFPNYRFLRDYGIQGAFPKGYRRLLSLHNKEVRKALLGRNLGRNGGYNVFHLKRMLLRKYLRKCCLCGHECGGQRASIGECPMGSPSYYHQHFVHVGEEKEVGRTLVIELTGCNLRCKFCQKGELIRSENVRVKPFNSVLWLEIMKEYQALDFDSISFLGGNPDQSIPAVLDFLESAPEKASHLPIVWHTNGYSTPDLYNILYGLVDLWIFDFKYYCDECALLLSSAPHYVTTAKEGLRTVCKLSGHAPVIVRHLALPGHWDCCQKPLIRWLSHIKGEIIFNPMPQYRPSWNVRDQDGELSRPISEEEFKRVHDYALRVGLIIEQQTCE
jgi:putative pyruvate formate lyase activating enzyme